jgi:excisionase family DNA binding protein
MQNSRTDNHSNGQIQAPTALASSGWRDPSDAMTITDLLELIETAVEHAVRRTLGPFLSIEEPRSLRLCTDAGDRALLRALSTREAPAACDPRSRQINHKGIPGEGNSVLSVADAAELLGISRSLTYELIASHDIPSVRLGRRIVVTRRAIEDILESAPTPDAERA